MTNQVSNNKIIITLVNATGQQKSFEVECNVPMVYKTKEQLQETVDDLDEKFLYAEEVLSTIFSSMVDQSKLQDSQVAANETVEPLKKKEVTIQGIRLNRTSVQIWVDPQSFKCASKSVIMSKNAMNALYEFQLKGVSYRGTEHLLKCCYLPVIPATTAQDRVVKDGLDMLELRRTQRAEILKQAGFDPETGVPFDSTLLESKIKDLPPSIAPTDVLHIIEAYNERAGEYYPHIASKPEFFNGITATKDDNVFISLDEISSKKQGDTRNVFHIVDPNPSVLYKRRQHQQTVEKLNHLVSNDWQNYKTVHNAVAVVEWGGHSYYIADTSVNELVLSVLAFLVTNGLLYSKRCVFFTDGAKNLKSAIEKVFQPFKPQIILDWYHVSRRMLEILSMALKGSIDKKRQYRKDVLKYLWVGDIQGAINQLESFEAKGLVKNKNKLEEGIKYIQNRAPSMPCYALRKQMSLRNSSSPAEKANDILVAKRQKHNGMSWSTAGSIALAQIAASKKNELMEDYIADSANVNWFKLKDQLTPPSTPPDGSTELMLLVS